jgi:hypothetical protein
MARRVCHDVTLGRPVGSVRSVRRPFAVIVLPLLAVTVMVGCAANPRNHARADFITQLQTEGGVTQEQATCIADKFFEHRTTAELKAFFARKNLTDAERAEFATLGKQCVAPTSASTPPTKA